VSAPQIEPDTKDWTWVLGEPCPECGFVAAGVDRARIGAVLRDDAVGWSVVLAQPGATERPAPQTWSPLEYACHVRDVHRIFGERLDLMLEHDEPTFANWDQDETAVTERYDLQDPADVAPALVAAAEAVARRYDALRDAPETTWARRGLRSNGSEFTVDSIARYHLHDVLHHSHDVRAFAARATAAAYDEHAEAFSVSVAHLGEEVRADLDAFAHAVGAGGVVLEVGSGGGRDAAALEEHGLTVRRTDVSRGFVDRLRALGHEADVLDPLTDELGGPYDGVWASASLLHVARADLPTVLARLAAATRVDGVLGLTVKEGDGEAWSTHGHVRAPRRFTFWREEPLRAVLEDAGWRVASCARRTGGDQGWLAVRAVRGAA
jgi:SAM-dependent methyltransferase